MLDIQDKRSIEMKQAMSILEQILKDNKEDKLRKNIENL